MGTTATRHASPLDDCADAAAAAALHGTLAGRNFFVTGANSGFGFETAMALAAAGGTVIMACRAGAKADEMAARVRSSGSGGVHLLPLDLASPASVRACAAAYAALQPRLPNGGALTALVLNAGVIGVPFGAYKADEDPQLQVGLLGHALLHDLLRPALEAAPDARVVVVASSNHWWVSGTSLDLARELPPRKANFSHSHSIAFKNLALMLWARALSKRVSYPVISLHPAAVPATGAARNANLGTTLSMLPLVLWYEFRSLLEGQTPAQGARTQTYAAAAPRAIAAELNGKYLSGNKSDGPLGLPVPTSPLAARDDYAEAVLAFVDAFVAKERG